MKLYDFDGMFDQKLAEYIKKNAGTRKESEWEDLIPALYERFGNTTIKSLGVSPNAYYAAMSDEELVKCLRAHLKQGVPVSEFLCKAIEARNADELLLPLLSGTDDEVRYAISLIGASKAALPEYMRLLSSSEDEDVRNMCVDNVKPFADEVKEQALDLYEKGVRREYMLEILSSCVVKDDRVFDLLIKAFRSDDENVAVHAGYLAAYGDERALDYLLDKIDEEGISYIEYRELKYAIESLGGSYDKERDFSSDAAYQAIKNHSEKEVNIFEQFGIKPDEA